MNGTVTVWCPKHSARCQLRNGQIWHEASGVSGQCGEIKFTIRRERSASRGSALQELEMQARARGDHHASL
jgi:hypothetical protein